MKIATFNIRGDFGIDGANNFDPPPAADPAKDPRRTAGRHRLPGGHAPCAALAAAKPAGYTVVGCGRTADYADEAMTLAVRSDTAELLGFDVFWLSPQPRVPGSRYAHQSECPRTCAAAIVNVQGMGGPVRVYDTHLDHLDAEARRLGLAQVLQRMRTTPRRCRCPPCCWGTLTPRPTRRSWPRCCARRAAGPARCHRRGGGHLPRLLLRQRAAGQDRLHLCHAGTCLPPPGGLARRSGTGSTFRTITRCAPRWNAGKPPRAETVWICNTPRRRSACTACGGGGVLRVCGGGAQQARCTRRMPSGLSHTRTSATGSCCACSQASRSTASFTRAPSNAQTSA